MSPIFKSDTARAIAKEVGLNDVSSMPKSSGKNKKRSLTISGSNPAVREALNNHQAKQEQFANRAIDDLDMEQALRNNDHRFSIYCQVPTHISSDKAFFKIVKKPSIVQK